MKKKYVSPIATKAEIEVANSILSASLEVYGNDENSVDTSKPGGQLTGGHRGEWGNLWK